MQRRYAIALILIFAFVAVAIGTKWTSRSPEFKTGDAKLDTLLRQKDFHLKRALSDGQYVRVNFWSSWCPPCVAEMPSMIRFLNTHKQFIFISISQDSSRKEFSDFLKAFPSLEPATAALWMDYDQNLGRVFNVDKLPETFIYDLKKNKTLQISGSMNWEQPDVLPQIEKYFRPAP